MISENINIKIPLGNLQNHMTDFEALLLQFLAEKGSLEVHDLRVLYRRLKADLWILEHGFGMAVHRDLKKAIRRGTKALGTVRELDVLIRDAEQFKLKTGALSQKRKDEIRKTSKVVLKTLNPIMKGIEEIMPPRDGFSLWLSLSLRDRFEKELASWPGLLPERKSDLHRLRIQVKKMVYRLEVLNVEVSSLREFQRVVGHLHDLEVLHKNFKVNQKQIATSEADLLRRAERVYEDVLEWRSQTLPMPNPYNRILDQSLSPRSGLS